MAVQDTSAYKYTEDDELLINGYEAPAEDGNLAVQPELTDDEIYVYEQEQKEKTSVIREIQLKKQRKVTKGGIMVKVAILLALGLAVGLRFASITQINYRNQALEKELTATNASILRKQVEINSGLTLTEIGRIAEEDLGMQKPQAYQIKYVDVERIDQTELAGVELTRDASADPWYVRVKDAVLRFFGIINP